MVRSIPAPTIDALLLKVRLSFDRWKGFHFPAVVADAIYADRLCPVEVGHAA